MQKNTSACCFTGHRIIPEDEYAAIQKRLEKKMIKPIRQGIDYFCAGGALGFDTMAALTVLKLKQKFPSIWRVLALPCRDQTKSWQGEDIKIYNQILEQADLVVYVSEQYYPGCMQKRNRYMVDNSSVCLCYLTKQTGGTAYIVNYAKQKGVRIIRLASE